MHTPCMNVWLYQVGVKVRQKHWHSDQQHIDMRQQTVGDGLYQINLENEITT